MGNLLKTERDYLAWVAANNCRRCGCPGCVEDAARDPALNVTTQLSPRGVEYWLAALHDYRKERT